jgi:hypothetical protein
MEMQELKKLRNCSACSDKRLIYHKKITALFMLIFLSLTGLKAMLKRNWFESSLPFNKVF